MKDMIKRIREEREGFTLAELLIVVAIIAVLVAIAIPVFNAQLEKSRDAVTVSNLRTAYAEAQTAYLSGTSNTDTTANSDVTIDKNASGDTTITVANIKAEGKAAGFADDIDKELPFYAYKDGYSKMGNTPGTYKVTFTYHADKISGVSVDDK